MLHAGSHRMSMPPRDEEANDTANKTRVQLRARTRTIRNGFELSPRVHNTVRDGRGARMAWCGVVWCPFHLEGV